MSVQHHEPHAVVMAAPISYTATASSSQALAANPNRRFLSIMNTGPVDGSIAFGQTAIVNGGTTLAPDQGVLYDIAVPKQAVNVIGNGAIFSIQEGN